MALKVTHTEPKVGRKKIDIENLILKIHFNAPPALNNEQLAEYLGISVATFYNYLNDSLEFLEAYNHYTGISAIEVLNSFKKLAVGYTAEEVTKELKKDGRELKMTVTKIVTKHFQPSAAAGQFYIKNKMPNFEDKIKTEHSGRVENIIKPLSPEELKILNDSIENKY